MDISAADAHTFKVCCKLLGRTLGKCGYNNLLVALYADIYLLDKVVNLILRATHLKWWVDKSRRTYNLLNYCTFRADNLIVCWGCTNIERTTRKLLKLLEAQRTVVPCCRESETVLDKVLFSGSIASKHCAHLRNGDVALVDNEQKILGEVVQKAEWTRTCSTTIKVSRVVLNAWAVAKLLNHLKVVLHALLYTLCLGWTPLLLEE